MSAEIASECYGKLETYGVRCTAGKHSVFVEVTKINGYAILLMDGVIPARANIGVDEAVFNAEAFLLSHGYTGMKQTYHQRYDNILVVNFAHKQNGFTVYPDLVKVEVSLETGDIIGFNATGYIQNHKERDLPDPAYLLPESEIARFAHKDMEFETVNLAVIPLSYGEEAYCYELKGKYGGKNYLVYIDAETLQERDILLLIEDDNGTLTI